jgi:hypothetical protein
MIILIIGGNYETVNSPDRGATYLGRLRNWCPDAYGYANL